MSVPPTFNNTNNINWFATSIRNDTEMESPESMLFSVVKNIVISISIARCLVTSVSPVRCPL